jgi:ribosomal protein S18 acetylase RimI-like enzyme
LNTNLSPQYSTERDGSTIKLECKYFHSLASKVSNAPKLSNNQQKKLFEILQENMKTHYEKSKRLPWDAEKKREEIFEKNMRFLICFDGDRIVAFSAFLFDIEDKRLVLYLYELQVIKEYQRYGIGSFLMPLVEQIAKHAGMAYVMLTVFRHNESAMNFYLKKCSYTIDSFSPSKNGRTGLDYEILSKQL